MRRRPKITRHSWGYAIVLLALVLSAPNGWAQFRDWAGTQEGPGSAISAPRLRYIETDIESERDTFHSEVGGDKESTRWYVTPKIGIGWNNYIYHPYLLTYSLLAEPGYVWQ